MKQQRAISLITKCNIDGYWLSNVELIQASLQSNFLSQKAILIVRRCRKMKDETVDESKMWKLNRKHRNEKKSELKLTIKLTNSSCQPPICEKNKHTQTPHTQCLIHTYIHSCIHTCYTHVEKTNAGIDTTMDNSLYCGTMCAGILAAQNV